ncbi:hypothetical protein PV04_07242 [Phialophora macrospora]|uniref:Uncharacterized protein n=1 Tax=Phialophora macrospora TaxID=1851006 RepID=A0A0D2DS01_9EURO|nr:hypothetical protein PV04_07242 [Phialophora macrospora]
MMSWHQAGSCACPATQPHLALPLLVFIVVSYRVCLFSFKLPPTAHSLRILGAMAGNWGGWYARFKSSQGLDSSLLNESYLEQLEHIEASRNETDHIGPRERHGAMREILELPSETKNLRPKAEKIEAQLRGADIQLLRAEEPKSPELQRTVAMLDDRSFTSERPRGNRGPLNAHQLYKLLKKRRFRDKPRTNQEQSNPAPTQHSADSSLTSVQNVEGQTEEVEPDAERRLICINDLDRWTICALLGTASYHEVDVLRRALYHHITFKASIDTKPSPCGLPIYQLAFHLPYYAWRSSSRPHENHRRDSDAQPLRQSLDVSFLNPENPLKAYLHPAHISCVITGPDHRRWSAYTFIDTYFDSDSDPDSDSARDSVQYIEQLRRNDDYIVYFDPFTRGFTDADRPVWDPMDFFLLVLRIRLDQIHLEWTQIKDRLQESFENHESVQAPNHRPSNSNHAPIHGKKDTLEWVGNAMKILRPLSECLSQTVQASNRFWNGSLAEIKRNSESTNNNVSGLFPDIGTTLEELEKLDQDLRKMVEWYRDISIGSTSKRASMALSKASFRVRRHRKNS